MSRHKRPTHELVLPVAALVPVPPPTAESIQEWLQSSGDKRLKQQVHERIGRGDS